MIPQRSYHPTRKPGHVLPALAVKPIHGERIHNLAASGLATRVDPKAGGRRFPNGTIAR